jgi:excinuclease ABC subunit B
VLVGINLLREGLDLPEVSLVAILDADQEGFLRSDRSLIQTVGRAARHVRGRAIFYADRMTDSMKRCIDETTRRRAVQVAFNTEHSITPRSVLKSIDEVRFITRVADARTEKEERERLRKVAETGARYNPAQLDEMIKQLEAEMRTAAEELDFETAARLRDEVFDLRAKRDATPRKRDAFAAIRAAK